MKKNLTHLVLGLGLCGSAMAQTNVSGPSSSQTPYLQSMIPAATITSIFTTTDVIGGYTMCGTPDGLGAFDNGNGTFTLLMNHEFAGNGVGVARTHGASGAFVSKWVINKSTLSVVSGADLIQNVKLWTGTTYTTYNATSPSTLTAFNRFCSADLSPVAAYYNKITGKGTQERIFMNGEESGNEGRLFGHIASGPNAGTTYELPYLGKFSCENAVASPGSGDKTVVAGMDDTTPGQVYFYVGNKTTTGTEIQKAGLIGGKLFGVAVANLLTEVNASFPAANTTFSLVDLGQVQAITGTSLNTMSNNLGVTTFLRPEDGAWDPSSPNDFYFNTTNAFGSNSRLWRLRFTNVQTPELGGTITAVLDGTEGQQMLDNMTIDYSGHIILVEDVGNNAHNGKVWQYDIANDILTQIAAHDPTRFISGGANFLTQDEEASGVLDVQSILGPGMFLTSDQAHYAIAGQVVEGGQLMAIYNPATAISNPEINILGNAVSIPAGNTAISVGNNTDFGLLNLNNTQTKTFVIQNTAAGSLNISGIVISGTNAGDFTLVNPPTFPLLVAANGSVSITVKFVPVIAGSRDAIINIMNNDYSESIYDFSIQGTGAVAEINLQGNNVNIVSGASVANTADNTSFGTLLLTNSVIKSFLIQNTGTGTLTVSGITISGVNASEFTLVNPPAFPLALAGNASQTIAIQFLPTALGTRTAMVNVANTDSNEPAYNFLIAGKGDSDVGIKTLSQNTSFVTLFPNPAKDEATVKITLDNNADVSVKIFDLLGKMVSVAAEKHMDKGEQEISVNTMNLKNGQYFVQVTANEKVTKIKLVVMH